MAYENGIFPWYNEEDPILWWSPDPRMVLYPGEMRVSKSLRQVVRNKSFELRIDTAFDEVMERCGKIPRKGQEGTWITHEMKEAYSGLFREGFGHSFETWHNGKLVGGLYGLSLGRAFFGESMFSEMSDASKFAFYHLHECACHWDFHFIDCQVPTTHLATLGAKEVHRKIYLQQLKSALAFPDKPGKWHFCSDDGPVAE